jgi:hypothetical protein
LRFRDPWFEFRSGSDHRRSPTNFVNDERYLFIEYLCPGLVCYIFFFPVTFGAVDHPWTFR